jgi:Spy/CpxP family protein refolding chaperone
MNATATATFVLVATFVGGLLAGVLVERTSMAAPASAEAVATAPAPRPGSAEERQRIARELNLTGEQEARIDEILDEQQRRIRAIMSETRPRTRAVIMETRARIEEVLTPEQQARFEAMHEAGHRDRPEVEGRERGSGDGGEASRPSP